MQEYFCIKLSFPILVFLMEPSPWSQISCPALLQSWVVRDDGPFQESNDPASDSWADRFEQRREKCLAGGVKRRRAAENSPRTSSYEKQEEQEQLLWGTSFEQKQLGTGSLRFLRRKLDRFGPLHALIPREMKSTSGFTESHLEKHLAHLHDKVSPRHLVSPHLVKNPSSKVSLHRTDLRHVLQKGITFTSPCVGQLWVVSNQLLSMRAFESISSPHVLKVEPQTVVRILELGRDSSLNRVRIEVLPSIVGTCYWTERVLPIRENDDALKAHAEKYHKADLKALVEVLGPEVSKKMGLTPLVSEPRRRHSKRNREKERKRKNKEYREKARAKKAALAKAKNEGCSSQVPDAGSSEQLEVLVPTPCAEALTEFFPPFSDNESSSSSEEGPSASALFDKRFLHLGFDPALHALYAIYSQYRESSNLEKKTKGWVSHRSMKFPAPLLRPLALPSFLQNSRWGLVTRAVDSESSGSLQSVSVEVDCAGQVTVGGKRQEQFVGAIGLQTLWTNYVGFFDKARQRIEWLQTDGLHSIWEREKLDPQSGSDSTFDLMAGDWFICETSGKNALTFGAKISFDKGRMDEETGILRNTTSAEVRIPLQIELKPKDGIIMRDGRLNYAGILSADKLRVEWVRQVLWNKVEDDNGAAAS